MFPKDWSEERIKEEIKSAWDSRDFIIEFNNTGKNWYGTSKSGIKIKGYVNKDRITAFPIYKEEN